MRETHEMSIGREALIGLASNVVTMGFGIAGFLLFARVLEPAALGGYLFVVAGGEVASNLPRGTGVAMKKRVSEADAQARELLGMGLAVLVGFVVVSTLVLVATDEVLRRYLDAPRLTFSLVVIITTMGAYHMGLQFYQGLGYPGYASWIDTGRSVITLLAQVALLLYTDLGPLALVLGLSLGFGTCALFVFAVCRVVPAAPTRGTLEHAWAFARWSIPDAMVSDVYGKLETLVMAVILGSAAVSFYQVPLRLVQPAAFVSGAIAGPLMVRTSGRHSKGMDVLDDLKNALSYTPVIAIPILFGSLAIPRELLGTVFGADYAGAGAILVGLAAFQFVQALNNPLTSLLQGVERIEVEFRASLAGVLVNVPLAVVLGLRFGIVGVVASTILSETLLFAIYQWVVRQEFGGFVFPRPIAEQAASGLVMFVAVRAVEAVVPITGWVTMLAIVGFGAAVYFGVLIAISNHFRTTALAVSRSVVA